VYSFHTIPWGEGSFQPHHLTVVISLVSPKTQHFQFSLISQLDLVLSAQKQNNLNFHWFLYAGFGILSALKQNIFNVVDSRLDFVLSALKHFRLFVEFSAGFSISALKLNIFNFPLFSQLDLVLSVQKHIISLIS
jgi:hypothetical protein